MTAQAPILGRFGSALVLFPTPRHRIPAALRIEFELLLFCDRPQAELEGWVRRLEAALGVTGVHRRAALHAGRKAKGLRARGDPEEIDALLRLDLPIGEVAKRLGLQRSYVQWRAKQLRSDAREHNTDASVPKFANDEVHVSAVLAAGGYGVMPAGIQQPLRPAYSAREHHHQPR